MDKRESRLEQARLHIAEDRARIAAQEQLIADFARDGHDTTFAVELLEMLRMNLSIMRQHLEHEEKQARQRGRD